MTKAVRRARLFMFLRLHRHELFLTSSSRPGWRRVTWTSRRGNAAWLKLTAVLQARAGDDEVIEATVMDRRWQLVLDCC